MYRCIDPDGLLLPVHNAGNERDDRQSQDDEELPWRSAGALPVVVGDAKVGSHQYLAEYHCDDGNDSDPRKTVTTHQEGNRDDGGAPQGNVEHPHNFDRRSNVQGSSRQVNAIPLLGRFALNRTDSTE